MAREKRIEMRNRNPKRCGRLVALTLLLAFLPVSAQALTLADVDAGATLVSGDLTITFEAGSVTVLGDLDMDLSLYSVDATSDGFELSGPLAVFGAGGFGTLLLDFDVEATAAIVDLGLAMNGVALGATAFGAVTTTFDVGAGLGTVVSGAGGAAFTDAASIAPTTTVSGTTAVQLLAASPGELASIATFRQGFELLSVAEPAHLMMLSIGLLGLAAMGRRRTPRV